MDKTTTAENLVDKQQPKLTNAPRLLRGSVTVPPACRQAETSRPHPPVTAWYLGAPGLLSFHDLNCWKAPIASFDLQVLPAQTARLSIVPSWCLGSVNHQWASSTACSATTAGEAEEPDPEEHPTYTILHAQAPGNWPMITKLYWFCACPH